ncbi:5474_t:CDS:2, partial [Funneliformis geosporum]
NKEAVELKVLPAKTKPLTETQLKEYGIAVADKTQTELFVSETYREANKSIAKKQTVNTFKDFVEVIMSFLGNADDRTKLVNKLPETNLTKPELDAELINRCSKTSILEVKDTIAKKEKEIEDKSKDLDTHIKTIINKKKTELETKKFDKLDKDASEDNRKNWIDLMHLRKAIYGIKYLQNDGDASKPFKFKESADNVKFQNALDAIELRERQINSKLEIGDSSDNKPDLTDVILDNSIKSIFVYTGTKTGEEAIAK